MTIAEAQPIASDPEPLMNADGTPTNAGWRVFHKHLSNKIEPVKTRPGRGGKMFPYINARQVMDRLDAVVGPGNWSTRYRVHVDASVECTLTIFGVSKSDVGYRNNPDSDTEDEPLKAAYSDAFKRAAVHWGVGRFLYGD